MSYLIFPAGMVLGFILAYAFHGTWKLIIRKAKASLFTDFADVKARIEVLYGKAEGDIKAELGHIRELLAKVKL